MNYTIESLPPEYTPGKDRYLDSIRQANGIDESAQGQTVRDAARSIWQSSLTDPDGFSQRVEIMEILMGDKVGGQEIHSLGTMYLHIAQPETFERFINTVANAKGWLEQDRAEAQLSHPNNQ